MPTINLYEDNAGTLIMVDGDIAQDMTGVQFDSTFADDVEAWLNNEFAAGDPGLCFEKVTDTGFEGDGVIIDLSSDGWTHVASYEDGEVTRHAEGGLAANNYLC
jgi:hypothetical protein